MKIRNYRVSVDKESTGRFLTFISVFVVMFVLGHVLHHYTQLPLRGSRSPVAWLLVGALALGILVAIPATAWRIGHFFLNIEEVEAE